MRKIITCFFKVLLLRQEYGTVVDGTKHYVEVRRVTNSRGIVPTCKSHMTLKSLEFALPFALLTKPSQFALLRQLFRKTRRVVGEGMVFGNGASDFVPPPL